MFRGSVKGTGYPLHSPVSPFTLPPVRHRVPSHFNWRLPSLLRNQTAMDTIRCPVLPRINREIKYRKMTCAESVASTGERSGTQRIIVAKHSGKTSMGDLDIDGIYNIKIYF